MLFISNIRNRINEKQVLKIVAGLSNFNIKKIMQKVKSAEIAQATYIDVAANPAIVYQIRKESDIPICVSSIDFHELYACFRAGADVLEIGNFDIFYKRGVVLSSNQIIDLASKLIAKAPGAVICVTVPCYLSLVKQINMAQQLEKLGVHIIQTEGYSSSRKMPLVYCFKNASLSLSSTYILSKYVRIPIISASKINSLSAPTAMSCGACGVAIGSFLHTEHSTLFRLSELIFSVVQAIRDSYDIFVDSTNISINQNITCNYIIINKIQVNA